MIAMATGVYQKDRLSPHAKSCRGRSSTADAESTNAQLRLTHFRHFGYKTFRKAELICEKEIHFSIRLL
jgi:hypothetical protein